MNGAAAVTTGNPDEAIEVVLRQADAKIECKVTWLDDEASNYDLESTSLHHAKREIKAWLARDGWVPVDGWSPAGTDGHQIARHFHRPPAHDRMFPTVR
jgi:hypothetical protein